MTHRLLNNNKIIVENTSFTTLIFHSSLVAKKSRSFHSNE